MIKSDIFCAKYLKKTFLKKIKKFSLLFYSDMLKYTCKSVGDNRERKFAHHFPPYHIGNRLGVARFQGGYRFF